MIIHLIYSKHVTNQVNNDHLLSFAFSITAWCWAYRSSRTYTQDTCFWSPFLKKYFKTVSSSIRLSIVENEAYLEKLSTCTRMNFWYFISRRNGVILFFLWLINKWHIFSSSPGRGSILLQHIFVSFCWPVVKDWICYSEYQSQPWFYLFEFNFFEEHVRIGTCSLLKISENTC